MCDRNAFFVWNTTRQHESVGDRSEAGSGRSIDDPIVVGNSAEQIVDERFHGDHELLFDMRFHFLQ